MSEPEACDRCTASEVWHCIVHHISQRRERYRQHVYQCLACGYVWEQIEQVAAWEAFPLPAAEQPAAGPYYVHKAQP